jgi:hypothetical protein
MVQLVFADDNVRQLQLRALKSISCYARGVAVFCLGESHIVGSKDRLSAGVNLYYGVLHVGVAVLDLNARYPFDVACQFIMPDCDEVTRRDKRLTPLTHEHTIRELLRFEGYGHAIGELLRDGREIREIFSYGPFIKLESLDELLLRPIYVRSDIGRVGGTAFSSFVQLVEDLHLRGRLLIDQYPSHLFEWVSARDRATRIALANAIVTGLLPAPYGFGPMPPNVMDQAQERIASLLHEFGGDFQRVADAAREFWGRPQWREGRDQGTRVNHIESKGRWG